MEQERANRITSELLKEVRELHFQTRRLADASMAGGYRSAFRGRGIEFEELRDYYPGDDVNSIDWKVTARTSKPHVKMFREERELTVLIAVDVSASTLGGTRGQLRSELIAKTGALLTLIALRNNDKVGLVTFSDRIHSYHPPRKARNAVWRILHEVLAPTDYHPNTDISYLLSFLAMVLKRRSVVFLVSDFISEGFEKELRLLGKKHDVTAILISDPADYSLPASGLVHLFDPETRELVTIDSSHKGVRKDFEEMVAKQTTEFENTCRRAGTNLLELSTDRPFIYDFRRFFEKRASRQLHHTTYMRQTRS